jgi:hypothetical protein
MAGFRSRIRHFRAPVVVTVALGAVPGCSGDTLGLEKSCPATAPSEGASCNYSGPACNYDPCASYPTKTATCKDGRWRVSITSCNPPPPEVTVCPVEQPVSGAYCNYSGPACEYDLCAGVATTTATCDAAAWTVIHATCNPPPPEDPDASSTTDAAAGGD